MSIKSGYFESQSSQSSQSQSSQSSTQSQSSNVISYSSHSRSRFKRAASNNPDDFAPEFDLIEVMREKERYVGDKSLSVRTMPQIALSTIERIKSRMTYNCGIHPICVACISYALDYFRSRDDIQLLLKMRKRQNRVPSNFPAIVDRSLKSFLSGFNVEIPGDHSRINIKMPDPILGYVGDTAFELGIQTQKLVALCLCYTLSDQTCVLNDHKKEMESCLEKFYTSVQIRGKAGLLLMDGFGVPKEEEDKEE